MDISTDTHVYGSHPANVAIKHFGQRYVTRHFEWLYISQLINESGSTFISF